MTTPVDVSASVPVSAAPLLTSSAGVGVNGLPLSVLGKEDIRQLTLAQFEGPLDLLLALVRRRQVEVLDIPMATITADYLRCLEVMAEDLSLEVSGDFLSMATALVLLKSERLLPQANAADGDPDGALGKADTIRTEEDLLLRLSQLEQFKEAANTLWRGPVLGRDTFTRPDDITIPTGRRPLPEPAHTLTDMFREILRANAPRLLSQAMLEKALSLAGAVRRVLGVLSSLTRSRGTMPFQSLVSEGEGRMDAVTLFMASLELAKLRHLGLSQDEAQSAPLLSAGEHPPTPEQATALLEIFEASEGTSHALPMVN
jgi:segregation and condensation protein A